MPAPPAAPSAWADEDLIGACKVAWNDAGQGVGWNEFSPDAEIEQRGSGYYVSFASLQGDDVRDCLVEGTPAEPSVSIAP